MGVFAVMSATAPVSRGDWKRYPSAVRLRFRKMQGLGNDFVVINGVGEPITLTAAQARALADRRFGVGCDQILILEPARTNGTDFSFRILNSDGSEAEQCGNGARCLGRFIRDTGLAAKEEITLESLGGIIRLRLERDAQVTVDMGVPEFDPVRVPFEAKTRQPVYDLDVDGTSVSVSVLALGNPHAVQVVDDVARAPVALQGPLIEVHRRFPNHVNVGFMQVLDRGHILLRVYERGAGETLACGSGACAAVVAGRQRGLLADAVEVRLPGGKLQVRWAGEGRSVLMTGPAVTTFDGIIELD
jgi:diaminopimelate epimerase